MRLSALLVLAAAVLGLSACGSSSAAPATAPHPAARPVGTARKVRDPATGSFWLASTAPSHPRSLIVGVHGHNDHAAAMYRLWQPYAARHHLGLVTVEWQTKWGRDSRFLGDAATYGLIRRAVAAQGTAPGHVLLHGFSQGSHEAFALTALDRAGPRLFALTLAESGGEHDSRGANPAFAASRWDIYCAGRDPWPQLSGCPAMRHARAVLQASGATIGRFMVDPPAHHGGFLHNAPDVELVLGDFSRAVAGRP